MTEEQVIGENDEDQEPTEEEVEEEELGELAKTLDLGQTGMVRLYRRAPGGSKFYFTETIPAEVFSQDGIDGIKTKFGGGEYRLQFCRENKIVKSKSLFIDPRLKGQLDQPAQSADNHALTLAIEKISAKSSGDNNGLILGFMQMMQQNQKDMVAVISSALAANKPQGTSAADIGKMLMPFVPLLRDLVVRRSDPAGNLKETLHTIRTARDMMGGNGNVEERPEQPGLLERLLELAAPALMGMAAPSGLQQPQGAAIQSVAASPAPPAPAQIETQAPEETATIPSDPAMLRLIVIRTIRAQYPKLLKAAMRGTEPASYFDVIADEYEDSNPAVLATLVNILHEPGWCATLFGEESLPHKQWFEQLRQEFIDAYSEPIAKEPEEVEKK